MRWVGHVARLGEIRSGYSFLVGKSGRKRPRGRRRRRWKDNIRMDLRKIEWVGVDWMHQAQDRDQWQGLVNTGLNLRVPWKAWNFLTSLATIRFSRRTLLYVVSVKVMQLVFYLGGEGKSRFIIMNKRTLLCYLISCRTSFGAKETYLREAKEHSFLF
jgi:hypothetical protein